MVTILNIVTIFQFTIACVQILYNPGPQKRDNQMLTESKRLSEIVPKSYNLIIMYIIDVTSQDTVH